MDDRRVTICIDDANSGAILYRLDDHERLKTLPVPNYKSRRPRQVRFADDSKAIVIGSDHGMVYVFDRRDGQVIDKLALKNPGWVQTIAVTDNRPSSLS